jgi:hypothetical protein
VFLTEPYWNISIAPAIGLRSILQQTLLGFSGYQPLVRAYIGQGLRSDLDRLEEDTISALIASLKRHGVSDEIIQEALGEIIHR